MYVLRRTNSQRCLLRFCLRFNMHPKIITCFLEVLPTWILTIHLNIEHVYIANIIFYFWMIVMNNNVLRIHDQIYKYIYMCCRLGRIVNALPHLIIKCVYKSPEYSSCRPLGGVTIQLLRYGNRKSLVWLYFFVSLIGNHLLVGNDIKVSDGHSLSSARRILLLSLCE